MTERDPQLPLSATLMGQFRARAEALGVRVFEVAGSQDVIPVLADLANEWGAEEVIATSEALGIAPVLHTAATAHGLRIVPAGDPGVTRDKPMGLGFGQAALAETGSVLVAEETLEDRSVGMLTQSIVFLCRLSDLVPGLDEASPMLRDVALRGGGRFATLITGPSRTADIERVLTVGVQGPGKVAVVFVEDLT